MKTKLDLYLAVQAAAESSLDLKPKEAEAKLESVLKPLNLVPAHREFASNLFYSRAQRMQELRNEPLEFQTAAPAAKPTAVKSNP